MVNRERLMAGGLRAYELGRLRGALRAALYLAPLSLVCAFETGQRETCGCLGVVLVAVSVFLRWRNRRGVESVTDGLVAGTIPLLVGLIAARAAPGSANGPPLSVCTAICLAAGLAAGAWIGIRTADAPDRLARGAAAVGVAVLAGSLGCVGLGTFAVLAVGVGLLVGGAVTLGTNRAA